MTMLTPSFRLIVRVPPTSFTGLLKLTVRLMEAPTVYIPLDVVLVTDVTVGVDRSSVVAHNSGPVTPSSAVKNNVPLTFVSNWGLEPLLPVWMSLTSWVPADVPSLFHSS